MTTDTETIAIPADFATGGSSDSRSDTSRRWDGLCRDCGTELDDKRKSRCAACKAAYEENHQGTSRSQNSTRTTRKTSSAGLQNKLNGVTANVIGVLTLALAWSTLRRAHIPDPSGDIADALSMTEEEANAVGAPLTRLFLRTEAGRRIAPVIVDNEDLVTAIFAVWDWYKRMNTYFDSVQPQQQTISAPPPVPQRRQNGNGKSTSTKPSNQSSESDDGLPPYIGPGIFDSEP